MKRLRAVKRPMRGSRRAQKRSKGPSEMYKGRAPLFPWRSLAIMALCAMRLLMKDPLKALSAAGA